MSATIDQRVVEMRFDNRHFENNVQTTMSTLEKLKQKLNLSGASKGLESIQTAAKNVNMNGLGSAVETVSTKFSALEVIGVTALANITNSAVNAGKRMVKALTIDPIRTGLSEYETQINAVQTILANTQHSGTTLNDVNAALDVLNQYADKTIYNFTEMTRNIGTFTAAGLGLEESTLAIKGIANLAAVSGSTSQQASTAMYQLSQALANGKVNLQDWNSVVNAGMGGKVFQDALVRTAAAMKGVTEETFRAQNITGSFRESISSRDGGGWLTAEVLSNTLQQFTGDLSDAELAAMGFTEKQIENIQTMAVTANDAATKVKTFTQLWDTLKEAAQSGWTQTWELIIGDFEQAKEVWSGVSDAIGSVIQATSDSRNAYLSKNLKSNWEKMIDTINEAGVSTEDFESVVSGTMKEHGINVDSVIEKYGSLEKAFKQGGVDADILKEAVDSLSGSLVDLSGIEDKVAKGETSENVQKIQEALEAAGIELNKFGVDGIFGSETEEAVKAFQELAGIKVDGIVGPETLKALEEYTAGVEGLSDEVYEYIDGVDKLRGRELLIKSLSKLWGYATLIFKQAGDAFREIFPKGEGDGLSNFIEQFAKLVKTLRPTGETLQNLKRTFKGIFAIMDIISTLAGGAFKIAFKLLTAILGKFDLNILDVTAKIGDFAVSLRDGLDSILNFDGAAEWIITTFENLGVMFQAFIEKVKAVPEVQEAWNKVAQAFSNVASSFKGLWEFIKTALTGGFAGKGVDIWSGLILGLKTGASAIWDAIVSVAEGIITTFCSILGIHSPSTVAFEWGVNIIEGLVNGIKSLIGKIGEVFKGIITKVKGFFGEVDWSKVFAFGLSAGVVYFAKKVIDIFSAFASPFEAIGDVLENVADLTEKLAKPIKNVLNGFAKLEKSIALNFKSKAIKNMVMSLLMLVGAIVLLTFIKPEKLWNAVGVIAALSLILAGLMLAMSKMSDASAKWEKGKGLNIDGLKTGLVQIGAALLLLAVIVRLVGTMKPEQALQGFIGLTALMVEMGLFVAAMMLINKKGSSSDIDKVGSMMVKLSLALMLMVGVCKLASGLSASDMLNGAVFATAFMIFTMLITKVAKSAGNNVGKVGGMLIKLSIAMGLMVGVCKLASMLSLGEILKGAAFAAGFVIFVKSLISITKVGKNQQIAKLGGLILSISISLLMMIAVCKLAGSLTIGEMIKGGLCVAAFGVLIKALVEITTISSTDQIAKISGTLLAASLSIGILAAIAVVLSLIDLAGLAKGVIAVGVLGLVMKEMIKATDGANNVTGSLIAMTVAIGVMAAAVALLSFIDPKGLWSATLAVSLLMGMFALIAKSAGTMGKVMAPLIVMTVAIGVLGAVLYAISGLPIESTLGSAVALSILMLALSASMVIVNKAGAMAIKALVPLAGMVLVMGLVAVVLGLMDHFNVQPSIETAAALSILMLSMSAACLILSGVGALAGQAILGAVALVGVIGVIGIFIGAIGALVEKFPQLESFLDSGIPILEKIGYGIGSFISSIGEGLTSGLPTMGQNIADFMGKLSDAATNASGISETSFDGVFSLIDALGQIGLTTVGTTLSDIFTLGGTSMEKFETDSKAFFKAMKTISSEASGITMDEASMTSVTTIATGLIDLMNSLPSTGGLVQAITGIKDLGAFGTDISTFIGELKTVNDAMGSDYSFNEAAFTAFSTVGTSFSTLMNGLPNTGQADWITKITGVKDLGSFGSAISSFIGELKTVNDAMGSDYTFNESTFTAFSTVGTSFSTLMNSLPNTGGMLEKITGVKDLGSFGSAISTFVSEIKIINDSFGADYSFDEAAFTSFSTVGTSFSTLMNSLPNTGGMLEKITGVKDLGSFGSAISSFIGELKTVNDSFGTDYTFNESSFTSFSTIGTKFNELMTNLPATGGWLDKIAGVKSLGTFGTDVSTYINELKTINDAIGADYVFNTGAFAAVKTAGDDFVELIESLPEEGFFSSKITMSDFSGYISDFTTAITDFSTNTTNINTDGINSAINAANRIKSLINSVAELDTSGIEKFTGIGSGGVGADGAVSDIADAIAEFSSKVAGIDTSAVSTATTAALKLKTLINGIVDIDTSGITSFSDVTKIGSAMGTYATNVGDIDTGVVSSSISAANRLKNFINGLVDLDSSGISNFKTSSVSTAIKTYASNVAGVDTGAISSSISAATKVKNFINSLSGMNSGGVSGFVKAINELGTVSIDKIVKAFSGSASKLSSAGSNMVEAVVKGFNSKQSSLTNATNIAVTSMQKSINSKKALFQVAGIEMMSKFINGISSQRGRLSTVMASSMSSAVSSARGYYSSFYSAGSYLVSGFANGISANAYRAAAQARAMATAAKRAAESALGIHSPSKVFYKIGDFTGQGFINGLSNYADKAYNATSNIAAYAKSGMDSAINSIMDSLNPDMEMQPIITPVLDLSNVKAGAGSINSMLGLGSTIGVNANIGAVSTMMSNRNQNGTNDDVVYAINKLGQSLGNMGNTTYNVNGVNASDDTAVVDAVKTLIRAAKIERRV